MSHPSGAALRRERRRAGRTLSDLAEQVGVSAATLSRTETGRAQAKPELFARCAEALGVEAGLLQLDGPVVEPVLPGLYVDDGPGSWRSFGPLELEPALRAAVECFVELGYHGTSVRDLARVAGISLQGLYHRYPSKQDLLVAVMEMLMEDFRQRCEAAVAEGHTPAERLALLVECFALFHTYRYRLAFIGASEMRSLEPVNRARIAAIRNGCQRLVDHEVEQLARENLLESNYPADASRAVVTMLLGIASWYRPGGVLTPEEIARRYVEHATAVVGLRRSPNGRPRRRRA